MILSGDQNRAGRAVQPDVETRGEARSVRDDLPVAELAPAEGRPTGLTDDNTRAWVALSALRTIAIGVEVEVW